MWNLFVKIMTHKWGPFLFTWLMWGAFYALIFRSYFGLLVGLVLATAQHYVQKALSQVQVMDEPKKKKGKKK